MRKKRMKDRQTEREERKCFEIVVEYEKEKKERQTDRKRGK